MLLGKSLVDGFGHFHILGGGRRRFHLNEQMGQVLITCLRQVYFIACPDRAAFGSPLATFLIVLRRLR